MEKYLISIQSRVKGPCCCCGYLSALPLIIPSDRNKTPTFSTPFFCLNILLLVYRRYQTTDRSWGSRLKTGKQNRHKRTAKTTRSFELTRTIKPSSIFTQSNENKKQVQGFQINRTRVSCSKQKEIMKYTTSKTKQHAVTDYSIDGGEVYCTHCV